MNIDDYYDEEYRRDESTADHGLHYLIDELKDVYGFTDSVEKHTLIKKQLTEFIDSLKRNPLLNFTHSYSRKIHVPAENNKSIVVSAIKPLDLYTLGFSFMFDEHRKLEKPSTWQLYFIYLYSSPDEQKGKIVYRMPISNDIALHLKSLKRAGLLREIRAILEREQVSQTGEFSCSNLNMVF
jgi:hypothetical protein